MAIELRQVKKALKRGLLPDPFFISRYAISPYQGCSHGCLYCDGRAEKYYVEGLFDKDIIARDNLPDLLKQERSLLREKGVISIGSGTSDSYQQAEEDYRITRRLLEEIADMEYPLLIATKNIRILRDLDLLKEIHKKAGVVVAVSLVSRDTKLLQRFEPGASSADERLKIIAEVKEAGLCAGVLAMPVLPGLCDDEKSMDLLYSELADRRADFIIPGGLTLRPGRQKDLYLQTLQESHQSLLSPVKDIYRENRPSGSPIRTYWKNLEPLFYSMMKKYNIPAHIPHRFFHQRINLCDEIYLLMHHMCDLYRWEGISTEPLKKALNLYAQWLTGVRRDFNRRRSLPSGYPDLLLTEEMKRGLDWLQNPKLAEFLTSISKNGIFNYQTLRLQT